MAPPRKSWLVLAVALASAAIGVEPLIWLVKAQPSPAQAKLALLRVFLVLIAFAWSASSRASGAKHLGVDFGLAVLVAGLIARIAGLALGIKHVGAVALVCDLYAACWLLALPERARPLSPGLLATAACLCLPVDRPLYRILGYPAQLAGVVFAGKRLAPEPLIDSFLLSVFLVLLTASLTSRPPAAPKWPRLPLNTLVPLALLCSLLLVFVMRLSPGPVDRGAALPTPWLPPAFRGQPLKSMELSAGELAFFRAVGGNAAKGRYGSTSVLVIASASPLRHLHSPTWCLAGLGHRLELEEYVGGKVPFARYAAEAPDGTRYEVQSTFLSSKGHAVAEVSEVIWLWLLDPALVWRSVQLFGPRTVPSTAATTVAEFSTYLPVGINGSH